MVRAIVVLAAIGALASGGWAFFAPASFYAVVATYPPYSRHFVHDAGAFGIALGATLVFALRWRDSLLVALGGFGVASVLHAVSHVLDRGLGGRAVDPPALAIFAVLVLYAGARFLRAGSHDS